LRDDVVTVVGNLVDNALESGGTRVRMTVSAEAGELVFSIEDDGSGVAPDQRERVFEEGVSSKRADGTLRRRGIGLALVRRVVERNHGSVCAGGSEWGGARFTARLPVSIRVPHG
jgi:two-component system CitB family sensor kinase